MKKTLGIIISSILLFLATYILVPVNVNAAEKEVVDNIYDTQIIPDIYNTGCKGELTPWREYFGFDESATTCYITIQLQQQYGTPYDAESYGTGYVIKNVDFSDVVVTLNKSGLTNITFENCYFGVEATNNVVIGTNWTGIHSVTFLNCTFTNSSSASVKATDEKHLYYNNCLFYGINGNAIVTYKTTFINNCYFHSIGTSDGRSSNGIKSASKENATLVINNCRFNGTTYKGVNPNSCMHIEITSTSYQGAVSFNNLYMTGGHYSVYFSADEGTQTTDFLFSNISVGNGCQYGKSSLNTSNEIRNLYDNAINDIDSLHVSSVFTENNELSLVVSNFTGQDRELLTITNNGSYRTKVESCPDYTTGLNYSCLAEFPFDLEIVLPDKNPEYVVCYDITDITNPKQVRFVNNTQNSVFVDIDSALSISNMLKDSGSLLTYRVLPEEVPDNPDEPMIPSEPMGGNIEFQANIVSWFEVTIPNSYNLTDTENLLEFSVRGDITGNQMLSVTSTESVILKNEQDEELKASLTIEKDKFIYEEIKNKYNSNILISVNNLAAGRYVGTMPIYIEIKNKN